MDGGLTCPNEKCGANIGKFAWQGLKCSCGGWVTPGFGVVRNKVDEVVVRPTTDGGGGSASRGVGARMPIRDNVDGAGREKWEKGKI